MAPPFAYSGGCTGATTASQGRLDLVPKKKSDPSLQPASAFLDALQDRGRGLKDRYRGKPLELAKRLGLKLPEKPVQKMIRLGVLTKEEAEEKYGPIRPGLREWIEDVCNKDVELAAVVASRGGGKALALTTPLPTPDGWTTMGRVRAGDILYGSDGRPCTVTKVYSVQKNRPCYEMFFSDQSSITCDAEHLWVTSNYKERNSEDSQVRTTQDVADTLTYGSREDSNHSIALCSPVRFPKRDLPIDPYLLGVWLGDGDSIQGYLTIATRDQDIVRRLERRGHVLVEVPSHRRETSRTWRVVGLTTQLRSMNLIKNKRVPDIYLRASVRQRRWLLAGLMDTDGTVPQGKGTCTFDSMDVSLADAVEELVVSLGWKATRTTKRATLYGKDCGESQRVWFRPTQNVFRTSFKRDRLTDADGNGQQRRHTHRMIKDVVRVKSEPVRCIEVDSPDHTYLCGYQMVPTHNSQGVSFIEFFLVVVEDFDALNLGGSEFQAEQVYSYLVVYFESDPYWKTLIKSGEPMRERTDMKDGNWIQVLAASPKSTRSRHAGGGGGKVRGGILVIDEEAEAEPGIVNSALPTVNTANPSITVRSSTFHKAVGSFQELIDNHVSMGYKLYFWDIIDVAQRCDCIGSCQNPEPCFREDHVEEYIDPEETDPDKQMKKRLVHRAYSFVGQEVVIVKSPTGKISCTTLKNLYRQFSEGRLGAERIPVPPGWEIFDHVEPPARWKSSVQWTPLLFVSRHRPKVGLRNIQLGSGDSLTVTDDHPFMLKEERTNKFVRADKVRLGDVGVVTDVIGHLGSTTFSLPSSVAYLIGQFLAEGNCGINAVGSKWVTLSGLTDPTDIENAAKESGFRYRVRPHSGRGWDVHFGAEFYDLLRSLGLGHETAVDKRLPENILEWSLKATGALLSGLIDGDGTVQHSSPSELLEGAGCSSVTIRVASKALVSQVQLCLRKLGMSGWTSYVGFYETGFEANYPLYRIEFSILEKKLRYFSSSIKIDSSFVPRTRNYGKTIGSRSKQVRTIKTAALGQRFVYDVTTGSETFWCSGIRTHNCGGRAMYADGWISMKEIVKLWMSMNRNHSQWEVEAMGSRPSTSGYVIKDHTKLAENVTEKSGMDLYIPGGGFITVCVDWGTVAAGIEVWQEQFDIDRGGEKHVLIACEQIEQAGLVEISSSVMGYVMQFIDDFQEVAADIGGGGNYLNPHLRTTYNIEVRDVNFNQEKESGIAAFNILSENNRIVIPQQFELMISQLRRWRRNNGGQVMKGNDHLCDAMVCNFSKFVDRMGISVYRVLPQTFNAGGAFSTNDQRPNQGFTADNRVPIAFGFGSSSR